MNQLHRLHFLREKKTRNKKWLRNVSQPKYDYNTVLLHHFFGHSIHFLPQLLLLYLKWCYVFYWDKQIFDDYWLNNWNADFNVNFMQMEKKSGEKQWTVTDTLGHYLRVRWLSLIKQQKKRPENMVQSKRTLIMVHLIAVDSRIRFVSIEIQIKRITCCIFRWAIFHNLMWIWIDH